MTSNKQCAGGHLELQSGLACSKLWVRATFCILSTPVSAIWSTSSVYCYFVHSRAKLESAPFRSSAMESSGSMVRALERKESNPQIRTSWDSNPRSPDSRACRKKRLHNIPTDNRLTEQLEKLHQPFRNDMTDSAIFGPVEIYQVEIYCCVNHR